MIKKVLVIDDDKSSIYLLSYLLRSKDYEVIESYDGLDGFTKAIECNPDIIILDIQLPGMDGYEVTRALRKEIDWKVPIVMLSAHAADSYKDRAMDAGAHGFISKPINPDEFISQITSIEDNLLCLL